MASLLSFVYMDIEEALTSNSVSISNGFVQRSLCTKFDALPIDSKLRASKLRGLLRLPVCGPWTEHFVTSRVVNSVNKPTKHGDPAEPPALMPERIAQWVEHFFGEGSSTLEDNQEPLLEDSPPSEILYVQPPAEIFERAARLARATIVSDCVANSQDSQSFAEEAYQDEVEETKEVAVELPKRSEVKTAPSQSTARRSAPQRKRKAASDNESSQEDAWPPAMGKEEKPELFCLCQKPYEDGTLMFECEGACGNWYHPTCIGITMEQAQQIADMHDPWLCPLCAQRFSRNEDGSIQLPRRVSASRSKRRRA